MFIIKKIKEENDIKVFDYRAHYAVLLSFLLVIGFFGTTFFLYDSSEGEFSAYAAYMPYIIAFVVIGVMCLDMSSILPSYFKKLFGLVKFKTRRKRGLTFRINVVPIKKLR